MKSSFGKNLKISIWGGSHEPAIGVDIEGLPIGTEIDMKRLRDFLARRAPGSTPFGTKRKEPDIPEPVSGLKAKDADDAALKGALPKEEVPDGADRNGEAPEIMLVSEDRISLEIRLSALFPAPATPTIRQDFATATTSTWREADLFQHE